MKKIIVLCGFSLLLAGCGAAKLAPPQAYTLSLPVVQSAESTQSDKTILVTTASAEPGFRSKAMIYTQGDYELRHYTESRWVAPPASMLTALMASALQQMQHFKAVRVAPAVGHSDYQLNVRLNSLKQSFAKSMSSVRLAVTVTLIESKSSQVIAAHTYVKEVAAPENNAYAGVVAANQAAQWVAKQVVQFVLKQSGQ